MEKINEFKNFMRTMPDIREDVVNGRYTWQQLYEIYDVYGEDDKFWLAYKKSGVDFNGIFDILKNLDLNALSKSFDGINKVLDLIDGFMVKEEKPKTWYDD